MANPRRLAAIAVGIAVLVTLVSAVAHRWTPIYDDAFIELRVRDVPTHLPLVGAVVMHLLFAWWSAKRMSPTAGGLVACGALLIVATTGATAIRDPWNPYVATLGRLALCCAAWSLAERHRSRALTIWPDVLNPSAAGREEVPTSSWVFPVRGVVFMGALVLLIHRRDRVLLRGAGYRSIRQCRQDKGASA